MNKYHIKETSVKNVQLKSATMLDDSL